MYIKFVLKNGSLTFRILDPIIDTWLWFLHFIVIIFNTAHIYLKDIGDDMNLNYLR